MPKNERKPAVIELKDGEAREVEVRRRTERGVFRLVNAHNLSTHVRVETESGVFLTSIAMHPDPIAAAELAANERCKLAIRGVLPTGRELDDCLAAIDAPPEPVGEYERGARDMWQSVEIPLARELSNCPRGEYRKGLTHALGLVRRQEPPK